MTRTSLVVRGFNRNGAGIVLASICLLLLFPLGCSDGDDDDDGLVGTEQTKPTFDWGYPEYSEYDSDGNHVGQTLYQTDADCQERLTFYECDFVNGNVISTPINNPTGASGALTGGDLCTSAIMDVEPSYCIPIDVCNPTDQRTAWAPGQASADNLAWQLFLALNWPADPDEPGYPDTSRKPGAIEPGGAEHAKAVWLDYPTPEDLFGVPSACPAEESLQMSSKISEILLSKEPPLGAIGPLGGSIEAGGGILIDQNGRIAYDDIRVNRTEWEFIVNQNDYWQTGSSLDGLQRDVVRDYDVGPGETAGAFPAGIDGDIEPPGDIGSMEIKASWKQLSEQEIASGTFYMRNFTLYDPDAPAGEQCQSERTMGLVGMHIVYQPALFGNPEWVWATFEHKGNTPTSGINDGDGTFNFFDPSCTPVKTVAECEAYNPSMDSPADFRCCPNLMLYGSTSDVPEDPIPTQVTRVTDPSVSTVLPTQCTEYYLGAIAKYFGEDNVWNNYFLVSTQWPLRGSSTNFPFYDPGVTAYFPCTLRNTMMETFSVAAEMETEGGCSAYEMNPYCRPCNGDCVASAEDAEEACSSDAPTPTQFATASCINCHSVHAGQNSSFIFNHRPCCVRSDGLYPNDCGNFLEQQACEADGECEWVSTEQGCG